MTQIINTINVDKNAVLATRSVIPDGYIRSISINQTNGEYVAAKPLLNKLTIYPQSEVSGGHTDIVNLYKYGSFDTPLDAKFDSARNKIWAADAGNNRVLRIDRNTLLVDFEVQNISFPMTVTQNENSGGCFVRAFVDENNGAIYSISAYGEIDALITYPCTPRFQVETDMQQEGLPSSMAFDHIRNKLWWVDQTTVYMSDLNTKEIFTQNSPNDIVGLTCISVNHENGNVLVGGFTDTLAYILLINKDNSNIIAEVPIPDSNIINQNSSPTPTIMSVIVHGTQNTLANGTYTWRDTGLYIHEDDPTDFSKHVGILRYFNYGNGRWKLNVATLPIGSLGIITLWMYSQTNPDSTQIALGNYAFEFYGGSGTPPPNEFPNDDVAIVIP